MRSTDASSAGLAADDASTRQTENSLTRAEKQLKGNESRMA